MTIKPAFILAFGTVYYLLSEYITAQISGIESFLALGIAFLVDILIYFITAVVATFIIQPRNSKENGRIMLYILTVFLILNFTLNNSWNWVLSFDYLIVLVISYILAFIIGRIGFHVLNSSNTERKTIKKTIIQKRKRITKTTPTTKKKRATKKKTVRKIKK